MNNYQGKIYTAGQYIKDIGFVIISIPRLTGAFRNKNISKSFAEKIMLVVTAVNGCRYCSWFHARQAAASGMSSEEIKDILDLQFHARAADYEIPALLYAQNYAETDRNPDALLTEKLIESYGDKTAGDINLYIRMIFFGNLSGNTFDAFLSRMRGAKAEKSSLLFELIFFILNFPFLFPLTFVLNKKK
jgi:AhpD family alkylhydroperoxidase